MRVASVIGARPELIKLAPIHRAFERGGESPAGTGVGGDRHVIVHTGQHYDPAMSDVFLDEFDLPLPDYNLGVGSGPHGQQTGRMLERVEALFERDRPDWVLAYGDTNSTLAAALAAIKLHIPLAHVEAGLRSGNRRMPEEHNRILVDHAADVLLAPTERAVANLTGEGLAHRTVNVGDLHVDAVLQGLRFADRLPPATWDDGSPYILATVHRAENTDEPGRLKQIIVELGSLPVRVVLPVHPRLRDLALRAGIDLTTDNLCPVDPVGYHRMLAAVREAVHVVTDSGGLQKECFLLRTPCTTLRTETEWPETLEGGWNLVCPDPSGLRQAVERPAPEATSSSPYGVGDTATRIIEVLRRWPDVR